MPTENKAVIRRFYEEVWNERNLKIVDKLVSPSHALYEPNARDSQVGPQAYKATVNRFFTAMPDVSFTIQDMIAERSKVVVVWIMSGTHQGEFYGVRSHQQESVGGGNHDSPR